MKENTLLKIALICSLAGLAILYFASTKVGFNDYDVGQTQRNLGDEVKLQGTIEKITYRGNVVLMEVAQRSPVNVVMFEKEGSGYHTLLAEGENIEIIGEVREYNGKNEIVADKVRVIGK